MINVIVDNLDAIVDDTAVTVEDIETLFLIQ